MALAHPQHDRPVDRQLVLPLLGTRRLEPIEGDAPGELDLLLAFTERILSADGPAATATALLDVLTATYGFARGAVLRGDRLLGVVASHALLVEQPPSGTSALATQQLGAVVTVLDAEREPWLASLLPPGAPVVVVPLVRDRHRLGALVLVLPPTLQGAHRDHVLTQVRRVAASASLALHRDQQLVQLQRLAATDDLTMIANRRSFSVSLERELARSSRSGVPVSLIILDIDHFKHVNDRYGHPAGDESLRNIAAALVIACRELDTPARYGGEEFAVVLPECDAEQGRVIADRLRAAVSAAPGVRPLTASAGVATFPQHAATGEQLIQAADDALLVAKRTGRDRTVLAESLIAPDVPATEAAWRQRVSRQT